MDLQYFDWGRELTKVQKCWKWTYNILVGRGGKQNRSPKMLEMDLDYFGVQEGVNKNSKVLEMDLQYFDWGRELTKVQKCWKWTYNILVGRGGKQNRSPKMLEMDLDYFGVQEGVNKNSKVLEMDLQFFDWGRELTKVQKCWKWTYNILVGRGGKQNRSPKMLEMDLDYFGVQEGVNKNSKVLEMDLHYFDWGGG